MDFYAYSAPGAGTNADELRSISTWGKYVDLGLNVFMLTGKNGFFGNDWEKSNTKKCFDIAEKLGCKKVILDDFRLYNLIMMHKDKLVGDSTDCRFKTQDELENFVRDCMKPYINNKLFYGTRMDSEPFYNEKNSFSALYKAIKKVAKEYGRENLFIELNLKPFTSDFGVSCNSVKELKGLEPAKAYEKYVCDYLDICEADCVCIDNHPFRPSPTGGRFLEGYYIGYKIIAEVCARKNIRLAITISTFEMENLTGSTSLGYRRVATVNEMMLQMNSALAFGGCEIGFYTFVNPCIKQSVYTTRDGSSLITSSGEVTSGYYFAQTAIEHAKKLGEVLSDYKYEGSSLFVHESLNKLKLVNSGEICKKYKTVKSVYLESWQVYGKDGKKLKSNFNNDFEFCDVESIDYDKDVLLITQQGKKDGKSKIYAFINVVDRSYKTNVSNMNLNIKFKSNVKKVRFYREKEFEEISLFDGVFKTSLSSGEAVWILPIEE